MTDQRSGRGPARPNELSGEVRPNTLRPPEPRISGRTSTPGIANQLSAEPAAPATRSAPAAPTASPAPPPSGWTSPQRTRPVAGQRRAFSWWTLIVIGFFLFNIARSILANSGQTFGTPTTAPAESAAAVVAEPSFSLDPKLTPGAVEFGTSVGANCDVAGVATTFGRLARVWWVAHVEVLIPADVSVAFRVDHDGKTVFNGTEPGDPGGESWDTLCGNEPIEPAGPGTYVFTMTDTSGRIVLSTGRYTLTGPTAAPSVNP